MAADDHGCAAADGDCSPDELDRCELATTVYGIYVCAVQLYRYPFLFLFKLFHW